jgi:hypothetical protein
LRQRIFDELQYLFLPNERRRKFLFSVEIFRSFIHKGEVLDAFLSQSRSMLYRTSYRANYGKKSLERAEWKLVNNT